MQRNGYTFRAGTHVGQKINNDALFNASLFWNEVHDVINKNGLGKGNIFNMDETPLFFNMIPNKTIAKRGKKTILIKSQNQEKCRISIILCIVADGDKLPPLIIFKGKTGGRIEKELSSNKYVKEKKCFICVNENACANDKIIAFWFYHIWLAYLKNPENLCDNLGYLILDKASSHITQNILDSFKSNNQYLSFVPAGLTRFIQPLDVVVNKPFKDSLRKVYLEYCSQLNDNSVKITREKMIEFICNIWCNPNVITSEMIIKSFKCTGIIYSPNQDSNTFPAWNKMNEEIGLISDDLGEDYGENDEKKGILEEMDID